MGLPHFSDWFFWEKWGGPVLLFPRHSTKSLARRTDISSAFVGQDDDLMLRTAAQAHERAANGFERFGPLRRVYNFCPVRRERDRQRTENPPRRGLAIN